MSRGHADWGVLDSSISTHETDLGELAARLGSPYTFTRSGRVLFLDTFKAGIVHWITSVLGTGSTVISLLTTGFFSPGSLRLISGTAVSTAHATIKKRFPVISNSKYGVEIIFWSNDTNNILEVDLYHNSGSNQYQFSARVNQDTDQLEVLNSFGSFTNVGSIPNLALSDESWNVLKVVVDIANHAHDYILLNSTLISSGLPSPNVQGSITDPGLVELRIKKSNTTSGAKAVYIASVVLTVDEP